MGKYHSLVDSFWNTSLKHCESNWAADLFSQVPSIEVNTTNASEQINSSTKCGYMATNPQLRIDRSCKQMIDKSNARAMEKLRKDTSISWKTILWSKNKSKDVLTHYAEGLAVAMLDKQDNYAVVQISNNKWWVYWVGVGNEPIDEEDDIVQFKIDHPIYRRVREVHLLDSKVMFCSCYRHCRRLMTCEHILCIVGTSHPMMYHIRWWNSFQLNYMRDDNLTEEFNKHLMKKYNGVGVHGLEIHHMNGK